MERDPTNGELALLLDNMASVERENHGRINESMGRIEAKVDHTNGRVRKLEAAKMMGLGALAVINILLVPLIVQFFSKLVPK